MSNFVDKVANQGRVMPKKSKHAVKLSTPGPKQELLKINGNWQDAIKISLVKKKQANGSPK